MAGIVATVDSFLWCMSLIYCTAFASLYVQIPGLYGNKGILPAQLFLNEELANSGKNAPRNLPTLLWFAPRLGLDASSCMDLLCLSGVILALLGGVSRSVRRCKLAFGVLWILYFSLYQVGQTFLWFQWDILLLEAGFLTTFLAPDWYFHGAFERSSAKVKKSESLPPHSTLFFFLVRWLLFRLMFASGVVKLTSRCPTWWSLTALDWHYESQCIPTPLAWYFHNRLPAWFHRLSVAATYVIEIPIPFLFFVPVRNLRLFAFWSQNLLQALIVLTGNYNFFNFLTMTLCLSLVDDRFFDGFLSSSSSSSSSSSPKIVDGVIKNKSKLEKTVSIVDKLRPYFHPYVSVAVYSLFFAYVVKLFDLRMRFSTESVFPFVIHSRVAFSESDFFGALKTVMPLTVYLGVLALVIQIVAVVWETMKLCTSRAILRSLGHLARTLGSVVIAVLLFSISLVPHSVVDETARASVPATIRRLHARFQPYHVTSSYGLFRRMNGVGGRPEVVVEGTADTTLTDMTIWEEIEFAYKPGDIARAPPLVAPHQPRLDWQMWFAALGSYQHNPWFVHLIYRLLTHEPEVVALLDADYVFKKSPPKYIRATLYHYRYTKDDDVDDDVAESKAYWRRERSGSYFPIVDAQDPGLVNYLKNAGMISSLPTNDGSWLPRGLKLVRELLSFVGGFQLCAILICVAVIGRVKSG